MGEFRDTPYSTLQPCPHGVVVFVVEGTTVECGYCKSGVEPDVADAEANKDNPYHVGMTEYQKDQVRLAIKHLEQAQSNFTNLWEYWGGVVKPVQVADDHVQDALREMRNLEYGRKVYLTKECTCK